MALVLSWLQRMYAILMICNAHRSILLMTFVLLVICVEWLTFRHFISISRFHKNLMTFSCYAHITKKQGDEALWSVWGYSKRHKRRMHNHNVNRHINALRQMLHTIAMILATMLFSHISNLSMHRCTSRAVRQLSVHRHG